MWINCKLFGIGCGGGLWLGMVRDGRDGCIVIDKIEFDIGDCSGNGNNFMEMWNDNFGGGRG